MNVFDGFLDSVPDKLKELKSIETHSAYWVKIEKTVNERIYDMYLLVPFFGLQEQIVWYNILVTNNKSVNQITRLQVITNLRILSYDYMTHEGRIYSFQSFDTVDIRPNPDRSQNFYSSDIGQFTQPINPKEFKSLKSPKDIIFLLKGDPVFTFNEIEESEKLLKVIDELGKQIALVKTEKTESSSLESSSDSSNVSLKCSHCANKVPPNSKYCNHCGARMSPVCSKCNHVNPAGSEFCSNCGFILN